MARPQQVFVDDRGNLVEVEVGFSWHAFFFSSLWAAAKRMWLPEFPLMLVADGGSWLLAGAANGRGETGLAVAGLAAGLLYAFVRGWRGNQWHSASLRRRGYSLSYVASDPAAARTARAMGVMPLVVGDYEEALSFYRDVLDFHWVEDATPPRGRRRLVLVRPGTTGVLLTTAFLPRERLGHAESQAAERVHSYRTSDCRSECERLRTQGVKILSEPEVRPGVGLVAVFADPYGNRWELRQGYSW